MTLNGMHGTGKLWDDLETIRADVATETASMARRKLLMNYHWSDSAFPFLLSRSWYERWLLQSVSGTMTSLWTFLREFRTTGFLLSFYCVFEI